MDIDVIIINRSTIADFNKIKEITKENSELFEVLLLKEPVEAILVGYSIGLTTAYHYKNPNFIEETEIKFKQLRAELSDLFNLQVGYIHHSTHAGIPSSLFLLFDKNQLIKKDYSVAEDFLFDLGIKTSSNLELFLQFEFYKKIALSFKNETKL